ncbi:MAG: hypothetical protein ACYCW6_12845, partial [Candidatus Xenobia bacterium]
RADMELREQVLPDEAVWKQACDRAQNLLGRAPARVRNAVNVAALSTDLKAWANQNMTPVADLPDLLAKLCGVVLATPEGQPRLKTARSAREVLKRLTQASDEQVIEAFVSASEGLSLPVLSASVKTASAIGRQVSSEMLRVLGALAGMTDNASAARALDELRAALAADEFGQALEPELRAAYSEAIRLLTPKPPP